MSHPTTMHVKPAVFDGVVNRIADPDSGQYLPEEGGVVARNGFWLRRLQAGDVVEVKAASAVKKEGK